MLSAKHRKLSFDSIEEVFVDQAVAKVFEQVLVYAVAGYVIVELVALVLERDLFSH